MSKYAPTLISSNDLSTCMHTSRPTRMVVLSFWCSILRLHTRMVVKYCYIKIGSYSEQKNDYVTTPTFLDVLRWDNLVIFSLFKLWRGRHHDTLTAINNGIHRGRWEIRACQGRNQGRRVGPNGQNLSELLNFCYPFMSW